MAIYLSPHAENTARQFDRLDNVKGFEYTSLMPDKDPLSAKKMTMNMPMDKIRLVEFYSYWDSDRGVFTRLLLIKYRDAEHCQARLMYLAGELTPKDLSILFENN